MGAALTNESEVRRDLDRAPVGRRDVHPIGHR
jgi:hypothetical protein